MSHLKALSHQFYIVLQVALETCAREERKKFSDTQKYAVELEAKYRILEAGNEVEGLTLQTCNELWREAKTKYRLETISD